MVSLLRITLSSDNSYYVTATVQKNRYTILSITGNHESPLAHFTPWDLDDPFHEGLKTCLLQDLHDDSCSLEPRPWVPLPPSFHLGHSTVRRRSTSEATETLPSTVSSDSGRGSQVDGEEGIRAEPLEETSEAAEVLWLHDLLSDLVNRCSTSPFLSLSSEWSVDIFPSAIVA